MWWHFPVAFGFQMLIFLAINHFISQSLSTGSLFVTMVCIALLSVPLSFIDTHRNRKRDRSRQMVQLLGDFGQPESLAVIAAVYRHQSLRKSALGALEKVTANLRPEHYGTLPANVVPDLCNSISSAGTKTQLTIMRALTAIGDGRAIRAVEWLVYNPPSPEVGAAAVELLPVLKQRELEGRAASQLLRASAPAEDGEQVLLRAVSENDAGSSEVLLRAVNRE